MAKFRFATGALVLILLIASSGWAAAQSQETISVIGSGIANSLIERLAAAGGMTSLAITNSGTTDGIDWFCNGEIDLATATRKMSGAERAICDANDLAYSELLVGHYVAGFITQADTAIECLDEAALREVLKPSNSNALTDWSFAGDDLAELPLTLLLPGDNQLAYFIADSIVAGDGLRLDAETLADSANAAELVSATAGGLALLAGSELSQSSESIKLLEISSANSGACAAPAAEAVESGDYDFALSLYVVVNRARLNDSDSLAEFLQFIVGETGAEVMREAGVTAPTGATRELNALILADADATLSAGGDSGFQIPPDLNGEVRLVGAANAYQTLSRVGDKLTESYERFSAVYEAAAASAGIARLCAGEADITLLDAAADADALAECAAKGVVTLPLALGAQATILISHAGDEYSACLTTDQVNAIWSGEAENWSAIDPAFPDQRMTLFGPSFTDQYTDILLQSRAGIIPPARRDTEKDYDPLYRAAAVGNVPGGLTYMSWPDYQRVLANEQANIQLVAVDGGAGCVEPTGGSIEAGSYPLSRRASLLISEESLAKARAQSFLWSLADDDNWSLLEREGFVGVSTLDLPIIRRNLATWFAQAEALHPPEDDASESSDGDAGDEASEDASE